MGALRAELRKLGTLPGVWVGVALGLVFPWAVAAMDAASLRDAIETGDLSEMGSVTVNTVGFGELAVGTLGAIVVGVVSVSSEYWRESSERGGGRQIVTTMTATPNRVRLALSKAAAVGLAVAALAGVSAALTLVTTRMALGPHAGAIDAAYGWRVAAVLAYWVASAWLAVGLTLLTRSGVLPLIVLLANASAVSVGTLLASVSDVGYYFPDLAGLTLVLGDDGPSHLSPAAALAVLAAWVAAALAAGMLALCRRDA